MNTYLVSTYGDEATYTVTLDESGVSNVEGLPTDAVALLQYSVKRHITNGLSPITALSKSVGPYSTVTGTDATPEVS
jgi:hypothetical protein